MELITTIDKRQLSRCGSFWTDQMSATGRTQARALAGASAAFNYDGELRLSRVGLTGGRSTVVYDLDVRFSPDEVIQSGSNGDPYSDGTVSGVFPSFESPTSPASTASQIENGEANSSGLVVHFPPQGGPPMTGSPGDVFFSLRLVPGITPLRINNLFLHRDFRVNSNYIIFNRSPLVLFPDCQIHIDAARVDVESLMSSALNVDRLYGSTEQIALYYRDDHSPSAWLRAACVAAGVQLFSRDSVIRYVVDLERGKAYQTDYELVLANYPHPAMSVGDDVTSGQVPGNIVTQSSANKDRNWWLAKFTNGLPTSDFCRYKNITIPSRGTDVVLHSWDGDNPHLMLELQGDASELEALWKDVRLMESVTDRWIYQALDLTIPSGTAAGTTVATVDALGFYMNFLLNTVLVLIEVYPEFMATPEFERLEYFLRREVPSGVVPLIASQ